MGRTYLPERAERRGMSANGGMQKLGVPAGATYGGQPITEIIWNRELDRIVVELDGAREQLVFTNIRVENGDPVITEESIPPGLVPPREAEHRETAGARESDDLYQTLREAGALFGMFSRRADGGSRSIRGPEDVDPEIRDEMCGKVTRAALAATGLNCTMRDVGEVADQLDAISGVRVSRVEDAGAATDSRDFLDVVLEDVTPGEWTVDVRSGRVFLITTRNGFVPEAMRDRDDGAILQFKR